jgi:hypothetical protein
MIKADPVTPEFIEQKVGLLNAAIKKLDAIKEDIKQENLNQAGTGLEDQGTVNGDILATALRLIVPNYEGLSDQEKDKYTNAFNNVFTNKQNLEKMGEKDGVIIEIIH